MSTSMGVAQRVRPTKENMMKVPVFTRSTPLRTRLSALVASSALLLAAGGIPATAMAQGVAEAAPSTPASVSGAPDGLIKQVTGEVMSAVQSDPELQAGNINKIIALVNQKILPHADFERTTQLAMGRYWRQASAQQRQQIVEQFKLLLIRTYSGAITQAKNQKIQYLPFRADPGANDVVVRTRVSNGSGDPIELDYRLEKTEAGWKVYDLNVLGAWLIPAYQQQFTEQVQQHGIDGLIAFLSARNQQLSHAKS